MQDVQRWVPPEGQSGLQPSRWGRQRAAAFAEGEWLVEAKEGSRLVEKGLPGAEEGEPPGEGAPSRSPRALPSRGGRVSPAGKGEPWEILEQHNNLA